MPATRPYFVTFNDIRHLVEAGDPAKAIQHVVGGGITEIRPARASEVTAWIRNKGDVEIAGEKVVAPAVIKAGEDDPEFNAVDARIWLMQTIGIEEGEVLVDDTPQADAMHLFDRWMVNGLATAGEVNAMINIVPTFVDALNTGHEPGGEFILDHGIATELIVEQIGKRKRHELWALDQPGGEPPADAAVTGGDQQHDAC